MQPNFFCLIFLLNSAAVASPSNRKLPDIGTFDLPGEKAVNFNLDPLAVASLSARGRSSHSVVSASVCFVPIMLGERGRDRGTHTQGG